MPLLVLLLLAKDLAKVGEDVGWSSHLLLLLLLLHANAASWLPKSCWVRKPLSLPKPGRKSEPCWLCKTPRLPDFCWLNETRWLAKSCQLPESHMLRLSKL